jgi:hypothetical protein
MTSFAPSACDTALLVLLPDHEAGDVLEEDERDAALAGELDEVRSLLRRLREEHALVGEDRDRIALDPREAADQRLAVQLLELVEARAVDDAADDGTCVELVAEVLGDEPVQLSRVEGWLLGMESSHGDACGGSRFRTISRAIASACSSEVA